MEVSGRIHAPAVFIPKKWPLMPLGLMMDGTIFNLEVASAIMATNPTWIDRSFVVTTATNSQSYYTAESKTCKFMTFWIII